MLLTNWKHNASFAAAVSALALGLTACQPGQSVLAANLVNPTEPGPYMAPAQMPTFQSGDKFYFTNGRTEQVVDVQGEQVTWLVNRKRKMVTYRNFVIPYAYYEMTTREIFTKSQVSTHALWPLSQGMQERFSTDGATQVFASGQTSDYRQMWDCAVDGTERVRVLAGTFDTFRVTCKRYSTTGKWWQTRTWFYAPEISAPVLRHDHYRTSGESKLELTAIRPTLNYLSADAAKNVRRAFQHALENLQSGETAMWKDTKSTVTVQVTPVATFQAANGQFCRNYRQILSQNGQSRTYAGVACRKDKLRWLTPSKI
jgi:surface antigen